MQIPALEHRCILHGGHAVQYHLRSNAQGTCVYKRAELLRRRAKDLDTVGMYTEFVDE